MFDIGAVVRSAKHYFDEIGDDGFSCNTPFVVKKEEGVGAYILEFTAAITLSGEYDGALYISMPREMLYELVLMILGEGGLEDELVDMAGEVVNTITGNLREDFGAGFVISVPMVIRGTNVSINLPKLINPIYMIPSLWREYRFFICVGLDKLSK